MLAKCLWRKTPSAAYIKINDSTRTSTAAFCGGAGFRQDYGARKAAATAMRPKCPLITRSWKFAAGADHYSLESPCTPGQRDIFTAIRIAKEFDVGLIC